MKLSDYMDLVEDGVEVTVFDKDYEMESYFYGGTNEADEWHKLIYRLSKRLKITKILSTGVIVNLSDVIEKNIDKLKEADLFYSYDIDEIMADMERNLSGNVSEEWMRKFVECLE